jgi:NTE family protein
MRGASGMLGIISRVQLPDTLVLGVGGTLGEAWIRGVLAGLEAASDLDFRDCEYVLGTSAGSIVAATLVSGRRMEAGDRAARAWAAAGGEGAGGDARGSGGARESRGGDARGSGGARESRGGDARGSGGDPAGVLGGAVRAAWRFGTVAASPLAPVAFAGLEPVGRFARSAALAVSPRPTRRLDALSRHLDSLGAEFDGRLRIAAVDRGSGRRVLFGAPGAPTASVRDAVLASCAVPWLFAPVEIAGRDYVDGGVWSPVNLDAAPGGRGAHVLCLAPTAGAGPFRAATRAALAAEEMALRARGMRVRVIAPDAGSATAIGPNLMAGNRVEHVVDAGFAQGLGTR